MERDPLTGVGARREFLPRGEARIAEGKPFVLAIINVDHFKRFNMHNGHEAGDAVLRLIAEQLDGCDAFRIAGDVFAIFVASEQEAEHIRRRIADNVNPPQPAHCGDKHCMGVAPAPRVSVGVTRWRDGTLAALVRRAEEALYAAKKGGRDRVEVG